MLWRKHRELKDENELVALRTIYWNLKWTYDELRSLVKNELLIKIARQDRRITELSQAVQKLRQEIRIRK